MKAIFSDPQGWQFQSLPAQVLARTKRHIPKMEPHQRRVLEGPPGPGKAPPAGGPSRATPLGRAPAAQ